MIKTLAKNNFHFPSAPNRVRCIAHIVNLVTKIILRQFDVKKKVREAKKIPENANDDSDSNFDNSFEVVDNDDNVDDLASLAKGLDREEQEMADDEDDGKTSGSKWQKKWYGRNSSGMRNTTLTNKALLGHPKER